MHYKTIQKLDRVIYNSLFKILNIEIFDLHRFTYSLHKELSFLSYNLSNNIPSHMFNKILYEYSNKFLKYRNRLSLKYKNKFLWLQYRNNENQIRNIKPIKFSYLINKDDINKTKYFLHENTLDSNISRTSININADKFKNKNNFIDPLKHTNNKWFINLTNVEIPEKVSNLLQMGGKFGLPINNFSKHTAIHEFIKDIENHNKNISEIDKSKIRNTVIPFFHKLIHKKYSDLKMDKILMDLNNITVKFCKNNPNIIFTRADKGNVTVALNKDEYIKKIETMLQDRDTYITIKKDPMKNIEKNLNNMIKKWYNNNYINKQTYFSLFSSDSGLPKAYGLPKIHKNNYPFRIIVSSINTALYPLASFLHKTISVSLTHDKKTVKNSFELYKALSGTKINDTHLLISLDAVSLFTNVPQDLAINSIVKRWSLIEQKTNIPKDEFLGAIELILSSTFFIFNKKIYRQTFGTPMGSPLSPVIANLVLQDLEEKALEKINCNIPFYHRYVDDIVLAAPSNQVKKIVDIFNSFHQRLQFTIEYETNRCINFLDLKLEVKNGEIILDWFHKETFSGRFLSFYSNHPLCHKFGIIYNLIDRAMLLSHPDYHKKNIENCIELLINNGYPLQLIFEQINKRLKKILWSKVHSDINNGTILIKNNAADVDIKKQFFVIPYVKGISEITSSMFNKSIFTTGYRCINKLDKIIKVQKDPTEHTQKNNIVYKIICNNCEASYVGQTKRKMMTRIKEHQNNIKLDKSKHSVITEHILELGHNFNWNNIKVLDTEPHYNKRLISEMLHIREQKKGINLHKDTEFLDESYFCLLNDLSC